jgi:serine/threonine protein kinase
MFKMADDANLHHSKQECSLWDENKCNKSKCISVKTISKDGYHSWKLFENNECKISDFGFAKNLEHDNTIMKSIVGTPLYMSTNYGGMTSIAPTSSGNVVRIIGYNFLNQETQANGLNIVYFNPDNTWIEL